MIIAGKMHSSGVDEPVANFDVVKDFIESGADVIMLPAVGQYLDLLRVKWKKL